ncbi:MAG: hypothetical protein K9N47_04990 [Prosthecobacter sp.]|uniref:hypothetical protein n=1 Tax=Prosthecobacter sp. TaxID=1965333 RepID=UPI0025D50208|nr:hypothetical protein [Prosthecobacter sp.]MCF7785455.1 hypothetical protein [Prosthecobacter sp.]
MSAALFAAGLGDVIRACYQSASYRVLCETTQPVPVLMASHNPFSIEIFRHHRNAKHFVLYDLAHKYEEFHNAGLRGPDISRALFDFAGLDYAQLIRGDANGYAPVFDAPDDVDSKGHIVFQPFAGNATYRSLPPELIETTVQTLRTLPFPVFLVTRSYLRTGGGGKAIHAAENARRFEGGNVTVLDSLSVPATLNLIKNCRAYVGSWSSLQQAAWHEFKPVAVFYPENYHDVIQRTQYAFGMDRENTLGRVFPQADAAELAAFLQRW